MEFSLESNGRIERTALYLNGEQLGGIKELLINVNEDGTYTGVIAYVGTDGQLYTKSLFEDYLDKLKVVAPTVTEEEARSLQLFTIATNGTLDSTNLFLNDEPLYGVVDLFIHVKRADQPSFFQNLLSKRAIGASDTFRAQIVFRNEDGSLSTENVFS